MVGLDLGSALSRRMGGRKPLDRGRENEERTVRGKSLGRAQSQEGNIEMKRGASVLGTGGGRRGHGQALETDLRRAQKITFPTPQACKYK